MGSGSRSTKKTGNIGEAAAALAFEKLGWGAVYNARHDLGTDLLLHAKTTEDIDPLLLVGAQVKSGPSAFAEPVKDGRDGWWFRDPQARHIETWRDHALPHLIVLHDRSDDACYWAHISANAILSTGKGAKIFVPRANQVTEACREALEEVANTARASSGWEGSAWSGAAPPSSVDALRYALIAPRLIAPHPNAGFENLTPEETIALLVQGRLRQYQHFAEKETKVPTLSDLPAASNWTLKFAGAIATRLTEGTVDQLGALVGSAPDDASRAAAAVVASCALLDDDRTDDALDLLEAARAGGGQMAQVDRAWLDVQYARLCVEVGRYEEARSAALGVLGVRTLSREDVTAGAIAGAAAALLFNTSPWDPEELKTAITFGDTVAVWWRSQTTLRGLDSLAERQFKDWVRETGVTFGAEDAVGVQLLSASMLANHASDQGGWRHLSSLTGQARLSELDRDADPQLAASGLALLVQAGAHAAVKSAVRHLLADGPAEAISIVVRDLRLGGATRTSAHAELSLLQAGGDVLDVATADRVARWLFSCVRKPKTYESFVARTTPTYQVGPQLLETLAGVLPSTSRKVQRQVIKHLEDLAPVKNQFTAKAWVQVLSALPDEAWTEASALAVKPARGRHEGTLQVALLGMAARFDPKARRALVERARKGSLAALAELGTAPELPKSVVRAQIRQLSKTMEKKVADAHQGRFDLAGRDLPRTLAVLNLWHRELARWEALIELLADPRVSCEDKHGAIGLIGSLVERIPEDVKDRLRPIASSLASGNVGTPTLFDDGSEVAAEATILAIGLGVVDVQVDAKPLLELAGGDPGERARATRIAAGAGQGGVGLLAALCEDEHPSVRANAAAEIARFVAREDGGPLASTSLRRAAEDPGTWVPTAIASVLSELPTRSAEAGQLLGSLSAHPSARVRRAVRPSKETA